MAVPDSEWPGVQNVSPETAAAIEQEVQELLGAMHGRVTQLLEANQERLLTLSGTLVDRETVEGEEVRQILCA